MSGAPPDAESLHPVPDRLSRGFRSRRSLQKPRCAPAPAGRGNAQEKHLMRARHNHPFLEDVAKARPATPIAHLRLKSRTDFGMLHGWLAGRFVIVVSRYK